MVWKLSPTISFQAKVGDFGLARVGDEFIDAESKFPIKWTAPEAIKTKRFDTKSDVWSFGITLWEVFSLGATPYPDWDNARTTKEVEQGFRMSMPEYDFVLKDMEGEIHKVRSSLCALPLVTKSCMYLSWTR